MKIISKLTLLFVFTIGTYFTTKACSPLSTPVITATNIVGNNLLINMNSVTVWSGCTNYIQIELVCNGSPFPGVAPFYYTSPGYLKNATPFVIPQMTVSLAGLCQGGIYQWRFREFNGAVSPWSPAYSFTMPGIPIPTTLTLNASPPAICFPQTSQLTASVSGGCGGGGAISYSWVPATGLSCITCSNPIANPSVTTTYTCIVSGSGPGSCWSATNTITVISFTAAPLVGAMAAPPALCAGLANTVTIASYSGTIQWLSNINGGPFSNIPGAITGTIITPTLSAGSYCYYVNAIGCGGALNSSTVCTVVNPNPTVTVNSPSICAGQTANLIANGAATYTWSAGLSPVGVNMATASPVATSPFTVTGSTNGCTATAVGNITVVPYPVVNLASNSPVCAGISINLTSTGGGVYQWNGPSAFTSTLQNPVIPTASVVNAGIYTVAVTTSACATTKTINIIVLNPLVQASNTGTYCAGSTVFLNGISSLALSYAWAGPGFAAATLSATIPNANPSATGIYTLTINDGTCSASATTSVTVFPTPVPFAVSNAPICEMSNLTFSTISGSSYFWTGPLGYNSTSQNPVINSALANVSGLYTVVVTDANGCSGNATTLVSVKPLPNVNVTGAYVCIGHTASLSATGGVSYSWSGPNGFTSTQQDLIFNNVSPSQVGGYTVVVTAANGCALSAGTSVTVWPTPQPIASCSGSVCLGGKVIFQSSGGLLYQWTGPNGFISNQANTELLSANSLAYNGTYTLGVIDSKGCQGFTTTNLYVKELPTAAVTANVNQKCVPFCSTFSISSASQLMSNTWNMENGGVIGGNTYSECFKNSGNYTLRANYTDNYGCANTTTYLVNVYPIPVADFHFGPGAPVENDQIDFEDASYGPAINSWQWYFADNQKLSLQQNPNFIFETPGAYPVSLVVSNMWGCKDTIIKPIIVGEAFSLYVPNVFSPNADGTNDTFQPKGYGIVTYHLQIFNRWGEKLFESTDMEKCWDGNVKGKMSKEDSYVWKIVVNNAQGKQKEFTGHVSILK